MITAVFTDYEYAYATGLWQWDYGQVLRVQGLLLPPAVEVHFSLQETGGEAVSRIGITRDGVMDVPIPDSMLGREVSQDYYIYAFIYQNDEISGETTHKIKIRTKARPKPQAFHTPEEGELFRKAIAAVNEAAGRAETAADRAGKTAEAVAPEIGENGNWMILGKDTGKPSRGKDGFPGKDGEPGAPGTPGKDGMPGEPGKSAYEYALDGGYVGTEEEFAERMAAEYAEKETAVTLFDFTAEEDIVEVSDFDIPSQKYKKIAVVIVAKANADGKTGSAHSHLRLNGVMINMWNIVNSTYQHGIFEIDLYDSFSVCAGTGDRGISSGAIGCSKYITEDLYRGMEIRTLGLRFTSAALGAGSTIKVTGVTV